MNMGPNDVLECLLAAINTTHYNITENSRNSQLHADGSLKARILKIVVLKFVGCIEV